MKSHAQNLFVFVLRGVHCNRMMKAGLSYEIDPKMVVFSENQRNAVEGVLSGKFDVGFFRADLIDAMELDAELFKVIEPKIYIMDDGNIYPFLHSTQTFSERPLSAFTHGMLTPLLFFVLVLNGTASLIAVVPFACWRWQLPMKLLRKSSRPCSI